MKKMTFAALFVAASMTASSAMAGAVLQVTKTVNLPVGASTVWEKIGDFCAIQDWHPAVEKCEITEESGSKFRTLTLGDGAKVKEKHTGKDTMGYMYQIVEAGPLPVKSYSALFDVGGDDKSATITWTASFQANGKSDSEAKDVMAGVFDGGLKSIKEMLAK